MGSGDGLAVRGAGQEDPRADDVLGPGTGLAERREDDLEAPLCLGLRIGVAEVVGPDRRRPRDEDAVARAQGARDADPRLPGGAGRDPLSLRYAPDPTCERERYA